MTSLANPGQPIVFHAGQADADILSQDVRDLHTYGKSFTHALGHDPRHGRPTAPTPFDANALAKAAGGDARSSGPRTACSAPAPASREFFFDETGDTNALTEAGSDFGGFGGVFKLTLTRPGADTRHADARSSSATSPTPASTTARS